MRSRSGAHSASSSSPGWGLGWCRASCTRSYVPCFRAAASAGAILGALLVVLVGTRIEPLRSDNFDFALVGPDWLAVLSFSVLALFQGMLVVALASRWGSPPGGAASRSVTVGRIGLAVVALAALPSFIAAVVDILSSG